MVVALVRSLSVVANSRAYCENALGVQSDTLSCSGRMVLTAG
jgi:hypothetical protein